MSVDALFLAAALVLSGLVLSGTAAFVLGLLASVALLATSYWMSADRCFCLRAGAPRVRRRADGHSGREEVLGHLDTMRLERANRVDLRVSIASGRAEGRRDSLYLVVIRSGRPRVRLAYLWDAWLQKTGAEEVGSRSRVLVGAVSVLVAIGLMIALSTLAWRAA